MKHTSVILTIVAAFCLSSHVSIAAPKDKGKSHGKKGHHHKGKHHRHNNLDRKAENAAVREEAILDRKDTHAWKKDPEAQDHRPEDLRKYTNHTYKRIVRLLTLGALEEADGNAFKKRHTVIVTAAKKANKDGLDAGEKSTIRNQLNTLNDDVNAALKEAEKDDKRTPVVNKAQHRFVELIEFGVCSGRLSTLEASSLRRKVKRLEDTENRLKAGNLTSNERERLMKEVIELNRDLKKELRD